MEIGLGERLHGSTEYLIYTLAVHEVDRRKLRGHLQIYAGIGNWAICSVVNLVFHVLENTPLVGRQTSSFPGWTSRRVHLGDRLLIFWRSRGFAIVELLCVR